jgi:hypothetical protein
MVIPRDAPHRHPRARCFLIVIPAKAGTQRLGFIFIFPGRQRRQVPAFAGTTKFWKRRSRGGPNPFGFRNADKKRQWIPAFAGMTR